MYDEENIYATIAQDKHHGFFIAMDNAQDNPSPIIIPALDDDRLRRITRPNFFRIDNTGGAAWYNKK